MSDPSCLFCKIAEKKIGAAVIYEDEGAVAFLDIHPRAPGHTLVIPKAHVSKLTDLADPEITPLFLAAKRVAKMLEKSLSPDGLTIGINQGEASGQVVGHLHVHLLPRFFNDGGGSVQSVVESVGKESIEEMAAKIRKAK